MLTGCRASSARARSAMCSALKPSFSSTVVPGAEAPKRSSRARRRGRRPSATSSARPRLDRQPRRGRRRQHLLAVVLALRLRRVPCTASRRPERGGLARRAALAASNAAPTSTPVAIRITSGVATAARPTARTRRAARAVGGATSARSSTGTFWRESSSATGPSSRSSAIARPARVSFASRRAEDPQVRDRAQRHEVLDRLVGGAVLAEADRVVRPDPEDRQPHQRGEAHAARM